VQIARVVKEVNEMATIKQKEAAKKNIQKAQRRWQEMTPREHALAQPEGRKRAKPGSKGEGDYFRIVLRPKEEFVTFRYHDVGKKGHIQRLAGKRSSGSWDTQTWLISKDDAHLEGEMLVPDTEDAKEVIEALGAKPKHVKGDIFEAKDRPNVPESEKPTRAQQRARLENIKKAQQARWLSTTQKE
jgi:hypothetical protein